MAASFEISKTTCHARSNSLPSRSHPLSTSVEEQLSRLRTSSQATTSSSLCQRLSNLKDLHESVDDLLQLQQTKQALSREEYKKDIEQVLDGSLRLLDVCSTTRDVFSQMRQLLQELQSSLRRKRASESGLDIEISGYMSSKKKLAKMICECLKNSKTMTKKDSDFSSAVSILNEVQGITSDAFQSLLSFISQPKIRTRSMPLVSKLFQSRKESCDGELDATEFEKMDAN